MLMGGKKFINAWNLVEGLPAAICVYKYELGVPVVYYNYLLPALLGYPEEQFKKAMSGGIMNILDYNGRRHFTGWYEHYLRNPEAEDPIDVAFTAVGRNGEKKKLLQKCNFVYDSKGTKYFLCVITDITEQRNNEKLLKLYTSIDSLTRIFNRDSLHTDIQNIIMATRDEEIYHAFIMFDIDNFKELNDKEGYDLCNIYLQKIGRILQQPFKYGKTVGRVGGDEFVLFLIGVKADAVKEAAEETCKQLQAAISDFTISIGISICKDNRTTFDELYKKAYQAIRHVKNKGKNGYAFFDFI